uniref:Ig-like domain-containing protein n=1 Tax=Vespula pensylvanica TaxID=30213 RepID=A0A834P5F3_VESPE|nr:hypothetical protein H0235_005760 [Vespula pensylvanica]
MVHQRKSNELYSPRSKSIFVLLLNDTVAWLRVDTQTILTIANHVITKNDRIKITHSEHKMWYLHIRDVNPSDQGYYMCQINTEPMKSQTGFLEVVVPPDILDNSTSTDMVVKEGSNVTLRCAARGSPQPNITWKREDGELISLGDGQGVDCEQFAMIDIPFGQQLLRSSSLSLNSCSKVYDLIAIPEQSVKTMI